MFLNTTSLLLMGLVAIATGQNGFVKMPKSTQSQIRPGEAGVGGSDFPTGAQGQFQQSNCYQSGPTNMGKQRKC